MTNEIVVSAEDSGVKLHKYVRKYFPLLVPSKQQCHTAFKRQQVLVNGNPVSETYTVVEGERVTMLRPKEDVDRARDFIKVEVCFENDDVAIVWKPSGVTPNNQPSKTLEVALKYNLKVEGEGFSPVVVGNLLDKASSGLVLCAKTEVAKSNLEAGLSNGTVEMNCRAICHGNIAQSRGIEVGSEFLIEETVQDHPATTRCKVVSLSRTRNTESGWLSTVDVTPVILAPASRAQVRVHLESIGHPVVGSTKHTLPIKGSDRNLFLALTKIKVSSQFSETSDPIVVEKEEPAKFQSLRDKEEKFWKKRMEEDLEVVQREMMKTGENSLQASGDIDIDTVSEKPVAYITGKAEFCGLTFRVSPAVMIPRRGTETLVNAALEALNGTTSPRILDLGTGSACIIVTLLRHFPDSARGVALDISPEALELARQNAETHGLSGRLHLIQGSFENVSDALSKAQVNGPFDLVVSNPPYLTAKSSRGFEGRFLKNEPHLALFSPGQTGLECYEEIERGLRRDSELVKVGGWLVLEVAHGMGERVRKVYEANDKDIGASVQDRDRLFAPTRVAVRKSDAIPAKKFHDIQNLASEMKEKERLRQRLMDEKMELHHKSLQRIQRWENTIMGQRKRRLAAQAERLRIAEEEKQKIDAAWAQVRKQERDDANERAARMIYLQRPRVKQVMSKLLTSTILQERDEQIQYKEQRDQIAKMAKRLEDLRLMKALYDADVAEEKKQRLRREQNERLADFLQDQVKNRHVQKAIEKQVFVSDVEPRVFVPLLNGQKKGS
ncbi:hypothetical protein HK102_002524 [Quaeritorhiza haematococci]|nr:hypothetical protein HK102_002524 [Quaeritorhiza haematococci]